MWRPQAWEIRHAKERYFHATAALDNCTQRIPFALNNLCPAQKWYGRLESRRIKGAAAEKIEIDRMPVSEMKSYRCATVQHEFLRDPRKLTP
jgi:hypothetical protein